MATSDKEAAQRVSPKPSKTEMRRLTAETLYDLEMECRRQGWETDPALVYDEERGLFRFRDGKFAFSREHAEGSP